MFERDGEAPKTIDLSGFVSSDDQNLESATIDANNILTIAIEDGNDVTVDLSGYVSTDDQNLESATIDANNILTIAIEDGNDVTVDLSGYINTDNQGITATLSDKTLVIDLERGGSQTVDLSFFDNEGTDDQQILDFSYDPATKLLTLELETGGDPISIDLGTLTGSDDQNLTSATIDANNVLTIAIEDGDDVTVDLSSYVSTDDQNLESATIDANNLLTIAIEDGNDVSVDLSGYVSTDDQNLESATIDANNILTIAIEDGNDVTVDLSAYVGSDDQNLESATIDANNILTIAIEDGNDVTVDLSGYVGSDDQALTLNGNTLSLEDGGADIDLSPYLDNTDNQRVDEFALNGNTISLSVERDGEAPKTIDLSGYVSSDDQNLESATIDANNVLTIAIEDGNDVTVDLSSYVSTDDQNLESATIDANNMLTIAIEDGDDVTVDLSSYVDTDNQAITATLSDKTLVIDLERGGSQTVDLSFFDNEGTDDQQILDFSYDQTTKLLTLELETGGDPISIDLGTLTGSDDQNLTSATIDANNVLTIAIEDGNDVTVDLSQFVDTDDQGIQDFSFDPSTGELTLQIEDGGDAATITLGDLFENIYTVDGTLQANRTVSMDGKTLNFSGSDDVVIHPDGKMSIGKSTVNPAVELEVDGDILAVQVHASSDARFKKDVNTLTEALTKVNQMRGVSYNFDQAAFPSRNFPAEKQVGFIAQEIEKVLPEVVMTDAQGFKAVDYSKVTALLTEAVKEQQKQIELLNQKLMESESTNEVVMSELASIKEMILSIQKTKVQVETADQD